ncbi:TPA: phosphatase PAP2 family protein [Enterobacter ludwigii]|uniref:phosphatase PAP2 family protein n=1 Tax=Enterobacter ludwigii TaxID=299767 RepID=UPI0011EFA957|nr:phosphatase PAP2 family protein [Enterobacter ludwigii]KAA0520654.1 inositol phosphorylceramide synthase [Enterobacter ludwigii]
MSELLQRLKQMLLGWGSVGVVYSLCDRLQGEGYRLTPLRVDALIPFSPDAVWLYLSFFLIVPLGYLLTPYNRVRWLARSMQFSALGAGIIYLLWPTTMVYPTLAGEGVSSRVLGWLVSVDSRQNCFPSLHAALTALAVWAIAAGRLRWMAVASVIWACAIAYSILQLRRHLFIDLMAGVLLAGASVWLAGHLDVRRQKYKGIPGE